MAADPVRPILRRRSVDLACLAAPHLPGQFVFLFSAATPLYATLAGRIFSASEFGRNFILGMALAVLGAGLLVAGRGGLGGGEWLGDLLR